MQYYKSIGNFITRNQANKFHKYFHQCFTLYDLSPNKNKYKFLRLSYMKNIIAMVDCEFLDNNTIEISQISVKEKYKNNGIATNFLVQIENEAIIKNVKYIKLYIHCDKKNELFFKKRGYEYIFDDKKNHVVWINPNYIYMQKEIVLSKNDKQNIK